MKHFQIITNETKDPQLTLTGDIRQYIEKCGGKCSVFVCDPTKNIPQTIQVPADVACVLVLGGDGTLLKAARDTAGTDIPVLGINLGTLGFLAEVEKNHYEEAIDRIFAGEYQTEKRMMLSGNVLRQGKETFFAKALNDITITRCGSLQIIRFSVYVNHQFLCKMSADGMIMATPTGSTGYNMSAGGPVIEPGAKMIVLTPICAHTLSARSIILRAEDEIEIEIDRGRDGTQLTVEASFDGNEKVPMVTGDRIIIRKSDETTAFMKLNELSFVEALHRKMSEE